MSISLYSKKSSRKSIIKEKVIKYFFALNGFVVVLFLMLIFLFLIKVGYRAFEQIDPVGLVYNVETDQNGVSQKVFEWYPTSDDPEYSLIPLILGSLMTAIPATLLSTLLGIAVGIYLSEIQTGRLREILKPFIELFAGIPTVVVGFFMLIVGATLFQDVFHTVNRLNAFIASIGLSFIIIPVIASLTEDALRSIPNEIRMASYSLGATKWQTIKNVLLPSAVSGLSAGIILGFGRAIGETMIVLMASGNAAELTVDIFKSVRTMTATIAAEMGEVAHGSNHYYLLFVIGLVLFAITFILNLAAEVIFSKMKKKIKYK